MQRKGKILNAESSSKEILFNPYLEVHSSTCFLISEGELFQTSAESHLKALDAVTEYYFNIGDCAASRFSRLALDVCVLAGVGWTILQPE